MKIGYLSISTAVFLFFSCDKIETFYPIDESKVISGRNIHVINDSSFVCSGLIDIVNGSHHDGIEFKAEMKNRSESTISLIEFEAKTNRKGRYKRYSSIDLVGTRNIAGAGPISIQDLIKAVNNQTWTSAMFYFGNPGGNGDSLYLRYRIELIHHGVSKALTGEEVYKKGFYIQPLSR